MERELLETMSEAALRYAERYTRSGGHADLERRRVVPHQTIFPKRFYNFPLLYALGAAMNG